MKFENLSFRKIAVIVMAFSFCLSVVGLGLAASSMSTKNNSETINISGLTKNEAEETIKFKEEQKKFSNVSFLRSIDDLKELLSAKATFLLYTGTASCAWCRIGLTVDENVLAKQASEFENGEANGLFRNASKAFSNLSRGPINDEVLNRNYPFYALHDLTSKSLTDYNQKGIPRTITDTLLGTLDDENDIELITPVPFKNGVETVIKNGGQIGTKAEAYRDFVNSYKNADEIKMRSGTESLNEAKNRLINNRSFGTPSFWAIINGQVRFLVSSYLTRKAIEGFAKFFLTGNKTIAQLKNELIS